MHYSIIIECDYILYIIIYYKHLFENRTLWVFNFHSNMYSQVAEKK